MDQQDYPLTSASNSVAVKPRSPSFCRSDNASVRLDSGSILSVTDSEGTISTVEFTLCDKYMEENWSLEVALQELCSQHSDAQAANQRLETENKRLMVESERLQSTLEELKKRHETYIAQARKHAAELARDKSDLQQAIDTLKAENARAGRRLPRFSSPLTSGARDGTDFLTPGDHDDHDSDVFGTTGGASTNRRKMDVSGMFSAEDLGSDSPEPSPLRKPFLAANHPSNEIETLQQRLSHAQRQISTLKGSLNREKQHRMWLEGGAGGDMVVRDDEDEDYLDENTVAVEGNKLTKGARGGRGRGLGRRRSINDLAQKLGMAANSPTDDESNFDNASPSSIHFSENFQQTQG